MKNDGQTNVFLGALFDQQEKAIKNLQISPFAQSSVVKNEDVNAGLDLVVCGGKKKRGKGKNKNHWDTPKDWM